jgi:nucleoside-diphosphate-sugar epimerase
MNVLITGANGFIGRALTRRVLDVEFGPASRVTLLDLTLAAIDDPRVRLLPGSFGDAQVLNLAFDSPVDIIFHLASVPGGTAEQQYELGRQVNLDDTLALLEKVRTQALVVGKSPVFVFASSIAVLGAPLPARVDDTTAPNPQLTYGVHKWVGEILLQDFQRRGWARARCLRLPGIVARPPLATGHVSAFMSDIIRELCAGRSFACPVSAESTTWLMSVPSVVENLMHAAKLSNSLCGDRCVWTLPALRSSMAELVDAIAAIHGEDVLRRVTYQSNPALEANFGRHPPLFTPAADSVGFHHDGDLRTLVQRALSA